MKTKSILLVCLIAATLAGLFSFKPDTKVKTADCAMTVTYSEMAYVQLKKAYKADSLDIAKKFLKKGFEQIRQASAYAVQCDCTPAETYTLTAYTIAKKAYDKGTDLDAMKPDIKKAMDLSLDAMAAAQACNK
jgi:hypothetical protein